MNRPQTDYEALVLAELIGLSVGAMACFALLVFFLIKG